MARTSDTRWVRGQRKTPRVVYATGSLLVILASSCAAPPSGDPHPRAHGAEKTYQAVNCVVAGERADARSGHIHAGPFGLNRGLWTQPQGAKFWVGADRDTTSVCMARPSIRRSSTTLM